MRWLFFVLMSPLIFIMAAVAYEIGTNEEANLDNFVSSETPPQLNVEAGSFNLQIQAVEVTQGVRGDIPSRVAPEGNLDLPLDGAVHIADRRTIVRAYPWVEDNSNTGLPPVTAHLWAYRDGEMLPGSPITPQNNFIQDIAPDWDLATMRSEADKSWNFVLPRSWTASDPPNGAFSLRFVIEINPPGPDHQQECGDCDLDNRVSLDGQEFVTVPTLTIQPYFVSHTVTDLKNDQINYPGPTQEEFDVIVRKVYSMLPVGDLGRGFNILQPIHVEWQGPLHDGEKHVFPETMIREYLPEGKLRDRQDNLIHIFIFTAAPNHDFLAYNNSGGVWLNQAWTGKPYAQFAARERDMIHELTHAIGLSHAGSMNGETTTNPDYPDPTGRIESNAYGFDLWELRAIPPTGPDGETYDYMSYNSSDPFWISIYTWETIGELLGQPGLDV